MTALASISVARDRGQLTAAFADTEPQGANTPTYFAVLFTDAWDGAPPTKWAEALRLLATLAEQSTGYLGYDVEVMEGGREYAVTHWASPAHIRQWKKSSAILIGDNGLLSRIYGREGCLWPWLDAAKQA
ncbi:MAG: hypothetical protein RIG67_14810 [Rhodospirillales bacterium]